MKAELIKTLQLHYPIRILVHLVFIQKQPKPKGREAVLIIIWQLDQTCLFRICQLLPPKIHGLWPFLWKQSVWQNTHQVRNNQNAQARIYQRTTMLYSDMDYFSVLLGWWANWSISDLCYTRGSCVHTDSWGGHCKVEWTYGRHCWTLLTGKFDLELLFHYYAIFPYKGNGTWKICYSIAW